MKLFPFYLLILLSWSCMAQTTENQSAPKLAGGPCEGCEAVFEYDHSQLTATDTLPEFRKHAEALKVTGEVYLADGKTPARDVILYIHHTNPQGVYPTHGNESGWGKRHGYMRGWIKTANDGTYTFYTTVPGHYPGRNSPRHIHFTVLEPDGTYYYIADIFFSNDSKLASSGLVQDEPRGGSGNVVTLKSQGSLLIAERDIVLGKNVPDYPE